MPMRYCRIIFALVLVLSGVAVADPMENRGTAENTPPMTSLTPAELRARVATAYQGLKSFQCRFECIDPKYEQRHCVGTVQFERPNKLHIDLKRGTVPLWAIANDSSVYQSHKSNTFFQYAAEKTEAGLQAALASVPDPGFYTFSNLIMTGTVPDWGFSWATEAVGGKYILEGKIGDTTNHTTVRMEFDAGSYLLEKYSMIAVTPKYTSESSSYFSQQVVNPVLPASTFEFKRQAGLREITRAEAAAYYDFRLKPGGKPYDFEAKDISGRKQSIRQYKGKVLLVDFWATWCGPCVQEAPLLKSVYEQYHDQGFEILGISSDQERADLLAYIEKNQIPWPQILTDGGFESKIYKQFGVTGVPQYLLVGRDGNIVSIQERGKKLQESIVNAVAKK